MQVIIGSVLKVSIRNAYVRDGRFYYQRRVPNDLLDKYPSKLIKLNLETSDPVVAARKVRDLNQRYDAEWSLLRADPSSSPQAVRLQAQRLLTEHGIDPKNPGDELDHFLDQIDEKRKRYAGRDEDRYAEAEPREFLSPVEVAALDLVENAHKDTLSDALSFYFETHHKGDSETLKKSSTIAMNSFIAAVGDKPVEDVTREDGRAYIKAELARGVATTTARRYLRSIVAILNHYLTEKQIDRRNPLEALKIAKEGEDAEEREPFTRDELKTLDGKCREADDGPRWLLALLADTGARLAEIGGLGLDDIKTDADIPHVVIQSRPWRPLKTKDSEREIPLVGSALWAGQRIKQAASEGQQFAFPQYVKDGKCKADSASATLNKWIRATGMDHTCHELRHTMRDRLRDVQCPEPITDAIGGWALKTTGQGYGKGYSLNVKREWLQKVTGGGESDE